MDVVGVVDWLMLASIAICIAVWPTQVITADQNRRLRVATIITSLAQMLIGGPRLEFLPAYFVIVVFIVRLLPKKKSDPPAEPPTPATSLTLWQWAVVVATAVALLISVTLNLIFPRNS